VSTAEERMFDGSMQQPCTLIQLEHRHHCVKGRRRPLTSSQTQANSVERKNRECTTRPITKEDVCTFHFRIFLWNDGNWYLSNTRYKNCSTSNADIAYHYNHLRTSGTHLQPKRLDLTDETIKYIRNCVNSHVATANIRSLVQGQFQITVPDSVIRSIRDEALQDLCSSIEQDPRLLGPAQRLISMFESDPDITFLYVTHSVNSGFVTYHRKKNEKLGSCSSSTESEVGVKTQLMEQWRLELRVSTDKILVCFAWCHDEDIRSYKMNPHFLAVDTTFGLNRQRRPLLLAVGTDGNQKSFTAFQSFMPSKQAKAYRWVFSTAMPSLLGTNSLHRTSMVCSDDEDALVSSLRCEMTRSGVLPNAKHRLDKYHIFSGPFSAVTADTSGIKQHIQAWISSFFDTLENETEFRFSYNRLLDYISNVKEDITHSALVQIEKILSDVYRNMAYVGNHMFLNQTYFDFKGDSIVESMNSNLKTGAIRIDGKLSLDVAASRQITMLQNRVQNRNW
jgi:hypothetical protein